MAILDDLANELLIDIVSRLRCDNQALFSLAVVSRRFCTITSQLIFRHITLENDPAPDPPSPEYDGAGVRKKTKALLLRSLCENDALSKEVRSCGPIEILPVPPLLQHGVDPMGFDLLSRCSNLEEVHIYCSIATTQDPPPHGMNDIFALLPRLQHLEAISLAGYPRSQTIAACLLVPSLRSLSVNNVSIMSLDDNDSENLLLQNSEHKFLRKLSISGDKWQRGPRGVCKTSTLNQLLLSCPGLEELHLDLPLGFSFWGYPPPEYTFSAIGIADSLRSLRDTLTVLQLTIPWRGLVESSDVPVDLSDLVRVKDLKISASCLLPMEPGPDGRDKLYQALPTNLEALHVQFSPAVALLVESFTKLEIIDVDDDLSELSSRYSHGYEWISQFPHAKRTTLTKLHTVTLWDDVSVGRYQRIFKPLLWVAPDSMQDAFKNAGIALEVGVAVAT